MSDKIINPLDVREPNYVLNRLTELMNKKGMTRYKLSLKSGVSQSSLSIMYGRNSEPSFSTLQKLCKAMNITLSDFFAELDDCSQVKEQDEVLAWLKGLTVTEYNFLLKVMEAYKKEKA